MGQRVSTGGGASDPAAIGHHGHAKQFRDVLAAIDENRGPTVDGHEGRRSVEIILAIYESGVTGKRVRLPLRRDPHVARKPKGSRRTPRARRRRSRA